MADECFGNNWVHMYISEITSRVVAESGKASDRFHMGKIVLQSLKDDPDFVMQIDGATGTSENYGSVLRRTIKCATSLTNMGLKKNDVIVLMAPNHLELTIPFYAGWYLGLTVAPTDRTMGTYELKYSFEITKPRVVFCQSEKVQDVQTVIQQMNADTKVISFDQSPHTMSLRDMMEAYGSQHDILEFKAMDIDPEETIALLIPTSGTTGLSKAAALTYKNIAIAPPYLWSFSRTFPTPTRMVLLAAPLQWLSTLIHYMMSPYMKYTRVQTSAAVNVQSLLQLIKEYKPTTFLTSPTMLSTIVKAAEEENIDLSSFEILMVGGSAVPTDLVKKIKTMTPKIIVQDTYGMSELGTMAFQNIGAPDGSCGKRSGFLQYRLIDVETKKDIKEPNKSGELWLKGPGIFKEYYNNPKATEEAFTEDRWFMTGDLMYRDENWNYYFVDRIKLLLKYRGFQISPVELETVIREHPDVLDVAVTGVSDSYGDDLPVACVVARPHTNLTADDIKSLVKEKLSGSKHLRGGVIFLTELPLTPSTKLHRRKIKQLVVERRNELE